MTETPLYIPARLKSAVVDGYVTSTEEVVDDTKGKSQKEVNQEVDQAVEELSTAISDCNNAIATEKGRAEAAEQALQESLAEETTRAKVAEESNTKAIEAEKAARATADNTLQSNIDAEVNRAKKAEESNTSSITAETTARKEADVALQQNLDNEIARAKEAEKSLQEATAALATVASTGKFSDLIDKPDSISGYGITDAYTKTQIDSQIAGKQDSISDLETIRSGAAKGATALQEHQSLENYYTKAQVDSLVADSTSSIIFASNNECSSSANELT